MATTARKRGLRWAVTRTNALAALNHFITDCLPGFGDYQDAMKAGKDFLFHGLISPYLNCGLLTAPEVCARAEAATVTPDNSSI